MINPSSKHICLLTQVENYVLAFPALKEGIVSKITQSTHFMQIVGKSRVLKHLSLCFSQSFTKMSPESRCITVSSAFLLKEDSLSFRSRILLEVFN